MDLNEKIAIIQDNIERLCDADQLQFEAIMSFYVSDKIISDWGVDKVNSLFEKIYND